MSDSAVIHNTFTIEKTFKVPPARVFAAFVDPGKKRQWFAESLNHDVEQFEFDFQVGGVEKASYRFRAGTPFAGTVLAHQGQFLEILPDQRIVTSSTMEMGGRRISASLATFEFRPAGAGTQLLFTHQGAYFEGADGPKFREMGWQQLIAKLIEVAEGA